MWRKVGENPHDLYSFETEPEEQTMSRAARIAEIKRKVLAGSYKVRARLVAEDILDKGLLSRSVETDPD